MAMKVAVASLHFMLLSRIFAAFLLGGFWQPLLEASQGKKKTPIMLISWQPVLGKGGSHEKKQSILLRSAGMHSNLKGHPECTRFLCFAALKETYCDDFNVLPDAMKFMGDNLRTAFLEGVKLKNGECVRLAAFSIKGDMPWLIEAGNLTRHFRHAPKKGDSQCHAVGICWFCLAGQQNYPFSDVGLAPRFEATEGSAAASMPWLTPSSFTETLVKDPGCLEWLYRPDVWHNFHLGHGRYMLASMMVVLMPLFAGTSVTARFDDMTQYWKAFCRSRRRRPLLTKISAQILNYGPLDWPEGGWQKAETTTLLCEPWTKIFFLNSTVLILFAAFSVQCPNPRSGWSMKCASITSGAKEIWMAVFC